MASAYEKRIKEWLAFGATEDEARAKAAARERPPRPNGATPPEADSDLLTSEADELTADGAGEVTALPPAPNEVEAPPMAVQEAPQPAAPAATPAPSRYRVTRSHPCPLTGCTVSFAIGRVLDERSYAPRDWATITGDKMRGKLGLVAV